MKRFELKTQHLVLLRNAYVGWQDCETGAPEINPKRPYGNSSVAYDVAKILHQPIDGEEMSDAMAERMLDIHRETEYALQIVLRTGRFEPGVYQRGDYDHEWRRLG